MRASATVLALMAATYAVAAPIIADFTEAQIKDIEVKVPQLKGRIDAQLGTATSSGGPDLNYSDLALIAKEAPEYAVKAEALMVKWWNDLNHGAAATPTAAPAAHAAPAVHYAGVSPLAAPSIAASANPGAWTPPAASYNPGAWTPPAATYNAGAWTPPAVTSNAGAWTPPAPSSIAGAWTPSAPAANAGLWTPSAPSPNVGAWTPPASSSYATPTAQPYVAPVPMIPATSSSAGPADPTSAPPSPGPAAGSTGGSKNVVYWGQNTEKTLDVYCANDSGMDTIVIAFTTTWGNGQTPSGGAGGNCNWGSTGSTGSSGCADIGKAITQCQANGKQVLMSMGGQTGSYSLSSASDAQNVASQMFSMFGGAPGGASKRDAALQRPFGDNVRLDGFDLDVESTTSKTYLPDLVTAFRAEFAKDAANKYIITGAPQCPTPEPNMGDAVSKAQFDELYIQFYNNPECATASSGTINFADWETYTAAGPSKDAKLFIGMPASTAAANAASFFSIDTIKQMVDKYKTSPRFGGTMLWDAGQSDANASGGKTFAQQVKALIS